MRLSLLICLLLLGCTAKPKEPPKPPRVGCTIVRKAIPEPSTSGDAEMSTMKDPSDPRYKPLDLIRWNPQLDLKQREELMSLYRHTQVEVDRIDGEMAKIKGEYFRAVVTPARDEAKAKELRLKLAELNQSRLNASLNMIDFIEVVIGKSGGVDRDSIQRALLREERRLDELEKIRCEP
ncbi:MAG: hypothetical protein AB7K68_06970 [Bacteriovoracia bacterium]